MYINFLHHYFIFLYFYTSLYYIFIFLKQIAATLGVFTEKRQLHWLHD